MKTKVTSFSLPNSLGTHLGLSISHKRPRRREVQFVVEKVRQRLADWNTKFLSRTGRLVLVQSTLKTIRNYFMQTTFLPISTLDELHKICNNFLWGGGEQAPPCIERNHTFLPMSGGLYLRSHRVINKCLMAKLGCKLCHGSDNLAKQCIESKFIQSRGVTKFENESHVLAKRGPGLGLA